MKDLKVKSILFSLLAIMTVAVFMTSCERESIVEEDLEGWRTLPLDNVDDESAKINCVPKFKAGQARDIFGTAHSPFAQGWAGSFEYKLPRCLGSIDPTDNNSEECCPVHTTLSISLDNFPTSGNQDLSVQEQQELWTIIQNLADQHQQFPL